MMPGPNEPRHDGGPSHIHIEKTGKRFNWLPWLLLALGLLALLFALSRRDTDENAAVASKTSPAATGAVVATTPAAGASAAAAGTPAISGFLGGSEPTPRTFQFEKLNFESGKTAVRAEDAAEVDQVAATLKRYDSARVRIAGFADARGAEPANMALGKARADSIKAALVAQGLDAGRIETVTGGESAPVETNATSQGRFENRRTELVVTAR